MRASCRWLRELSGVDLDAETVSEHLTAAGLEVESIERFGAHLERVVVAEVRSKSKIPDRDKLSHVRLFDGAGEVDVVCGASNVPDAGGKVLLAQVGAVLPGGLSIGERKLGGVQSKGMICSESELGIGDGTDGIVDVGRLGLSSEATAGLSALEALGLSDQVLEIGLTPNRPDCLGHVGLARELAIAAGVAFDVAAPPKPKRWADVSAVWDGSPVELSFASSDGTDGAEPSSLDPGQRVQVTIADPERCPRYGAGLVSGVRVGPSPWWVRYRLFTLGLRAIHNVVDATNLAMMETGHPVHAFDLARVRERRIHVRSAEAGERMATLDGVERRFVEDDLLICDGEGPVAVAGVMGGADSEIRSDTTTVLVECAYFSPQSVRRTSRRLGLHTDASHRFERGVDPNGVPHTLARTVQLVAEFGGGVAHLSGVDIHPAPVAPTTIPFRIARADRILGFATPPDVGKRIFVGLGARIQAGEAENRFEVVAPTWRPDLTREEDLIEELARVQGYDRVPALVPHVRPSPTGSPRRVALERRLREAAASVGLYEAVTYAFISSDERERVRADGGSVTIANPLSEERSELRTSLLPGLAAAARRSMRRQVSQVCFFELGRTYHASTDTLPVERAMLGFLLGGPRRQWISGDDPFDFYDGKGVVEYLVESALGSSPKPVPLAEGSERAHLHPRRSAGFATSGRTVGWVGELHPEVSEAMELPGRPVYGELDVDTVLEIVRGLAAPQAAELPRFPSATRDLALVVGESEKAGEIAATLIEAGDGLVETADLFDLYRGEAIPEGQKSLAFRVSYRDRERTLTDKEVDRLHQRVQRTACERHRAMVR